MEHTSKIGMGGGCHWCTEAVFQSLKGVVSVEQGYIASARGASSFSEGVIITFQPDIVPLHRLIEIHLYTHHSTSDHSFRKKYRSAVYYLDPGHQKEALAALENIQEDFKEPIITQVLPFREFRASRESLLDYYRSDPQKPFCHRYIHPKLEFLRERFGKDVK